MRNLCHYEFPTQTTTRTANKTHTRFCGLLVIRVNGKEKDERHPRRMWRKGTLERTGTGSGSSDKKVSTDPTNPKSSSVESDSPGPRRARVVIR